ncbi:hypothetical protein [Streptomyces broussonetiae]|uniref:Secreted protein n=1 Tax=Streptomyces broussonetiae TaxID=2686304 RepID=A0ABV5ELL9_9ACTN
MTAPVGVPVAGAAGATVAVMVTSSPAVEGSGVEVTVVVVAEGPTVWLSVPVEGEKLPSPP